MEKSIRPYIFISYAHKDNAMVLPLIEDLKARGFNVWYDAGIEAGTEWPEYIGTKVFYCNCMIFFLSPNSAVSSNCRREVDFAVALEKRVLAIHLVDDSEIQLSPGLQMTLNNKQAMFYTRSPSKEMFLDNLCAAEILKECRITDEWDTLYADDEDVLPQFEASALSPLKAPKEQKDLDPEKARSNAEREFVLGCNRESEGNLEKAFAHYECAADQGHPEAMFRLAECMQQGKGTGKNENEAYVWYQRAGEHGVTEAMLQQAKLFELTNGTQKGRDKAALLLSIAARLNNTEAMYTLGMLYLQNGQTEEQRDEGVAWLQAAAKREHADAMYQLGVYYRDASQEEESLKWLDAAAYWRHPDALYALAQYHEQKEKDNDGNPGVLAGLIRQKNKESDKWYLLAAQQGHFEAADQICKWGHADASEEALFTAYEVCAGKGHKASMTRLAEAYEKGLGTEENPEQAAAWYRKAAYAGEYKAMYAWAECCFLGKGTKTDYKEAVAFYEKSFNNGIYGATRRLAECYRNGLGTAKNEKRAFEYLSSMEGAYGYYPKEYYAVSEYYALGIGTPKNPEKAFENCRNAAVRYLPEACLQLAKYYETGFGTEVDQQKATDWYRRAAEEGVVPAMVIVADRYAAGIGVEKSPEEAYAWYQRAAEKQAYSAELKVAVCMLQGFGTMKSAGQGLGELWRLAETQKDPNAAMYAASFFDRCGDWHPALTNYLIAAGGGCDEAMEILRERRYRRMIWRNPGRLIQYLRAKRAYRENYGSFSRISMPWEEE